MPSPAGAVLPALLAGRVLADAQAMIEATAPAGGGEQRTFRLNAPAPVVAHVDRLRLEQVLSCLVENAIRYSPHETVVELSVEQPDPGHVAIAVRDHGVGVPPAEREHLFEPFFQSPLRAAAGGMGLGLYVSREIVHLHEGTISAEFPPDGGTRFVITLPLAPGR
jgi:signal transduction histidine kinase